MSIIRVGLAETKNFAAGYDAIFGKKKKEAPAKKAAAAPKNGAAKNGTAKTTVAKKKPKAKKK